MYFVRSVYACVLPLSRHFCLTQSHVTRRLANAYTLSCLLLYLQVVSLGCVVYKDVEKSSDDECPVDIDTEMLVQVVQTKPALYNHNLKSYYCKELVDIQWEEVAQKMGVSAVECKAKWQNIRNGYSRHLRNERELYTPGCTARKRKKWYLAEKLSFLDEFMAQRRKPDNNASFRYDTDEIQSLPFIDTQYATDPAPDQEFTDNAKEAEEMHFSYLNTTPRKKPRRSEKLSEFLLEQIIGVLKSRVQETRTETESTDLTFFKSLIPDIEKLDDRTKRKFKENVLKNLHSLLDEQEAAASKEIANDV